MQKVVALAVVTISGGLVQLSDSQARKRAGRVRSTDKKGIYEVIEPIQFKAGEGFGTDEITKTIEPFVEVIKPKAAKPAKAVSQDEASDEVSGD